MSTNRSGAFTRPVTWMGLVALCVIAWIVYNSMFSIESQFRAAINSSYREAPALVPLPCNFPYVYIPEQTYRVDHNALEALTKVGLLTARATTTPVFRYGQGNVPVSATEYAISPEGNKYLTKSAGTGFFATHQEGFLYGQIEVARITNYTEGNFLGARLAQVKFIPRLTRVEHWAEDPQAQAAFPDMAQAIKNRDGEPEQTTTLYFTGKGWSGKL